MADMDADAIIEAVEREWRHTYGKPLTAALVALYEANLAIGEANLECALAGLGSDETAIRDAAGEAALAEVNLVCAIGAVTAIIEGGGTP
jgi:hypothetical protein